MPLLVILSLFVLAPLLEIYVLIKVGSEVGALNTIALCILTAVAGATLIRIQGISTLLRIRTGLERGEVPALELLEGAQLAVAGALLLTPGFVTDTLGFVLLVPAVRRALARGVIERHSTRINRPPGGGPGQPRQPDVIEGDYRRIDD